MVKTLRIFLRCVYFFFGAIAATASGFLFFAMGMLFYGMAKDALLALLVLLK